jgi:ABC-type branched-subunit amino acid transport system ATPase component
MKSGYPKKLWSGSGVVRADRSGPSVPKTPRAGRSPGGFSGRSGSRATEAAEIPLLDLERLTIRRDGRAIVQDLNLDVVEGKLTGLATTDPEVAAAVLDSIVGRIRPASGMVRLRGRRLEQRFSSGMFWLAMLVGGILGLAVAGVAVDASRLWHAVVIRPRDAGEAASLRGIRHRLRGYFRAELAVDAAADGWRVVSADGREVLAQAADLDEARSLRNILQAAVTARRAGPGTIPDPTDLAGATTDMPAAAAIREEVLDRVAAGKRQVRVRGLLGLACGWLVGVMGTICLWWRGRRSPALVTRMGIARVPRLDRSVAGEPARHDSVAPSSAGCDTTPRLWDANRLVPEKSSEATDDPIGASDPGECRRLQIDAAVSAGARLLLIEDPTAGLDEAAATALVVFCQRLRDEGLTILAAGRPDDPLLLATDRLAILEAGRRVFLGTPQESGLVSAVQSAAEGG